MYSPETRQSALFLLSLWIQISPLGAQHAVQASAIKPFPVAFSHLVSCCSAGSLIALLCRMASVSLGTDRIRYNATYRNEVLSPARTGLPYWLM